jgi:N-formylglutamate amidohydrolase
MKGREQGFDSNTHSKILRRRVGDAVALVLPERQTAPLVFSSPHSGTDYKEEFLKSSLLNAQELRRSEDSYVDELFEFAPYHGAPLLHALFPRAYIDPNREPYELDPEMFHDTLPDFVKTRSDRVRAGFGTIARVVANGAQIYREKMLFSDADARVQTYYAPYHAQLRRLVEETQQRFGFAILLDCHSMPSVGSANDRDTGQQRADIVLGDRFGTACAAIVVDEAEKALTGLGLRVARNDPYAGAHTTTHYGRPAKGVHALQIEINRGLYMLEDHFTRSSGHAALTKRMGQFSNIMAETDWQSLT